MSLVLKKKKRQPRVSDDGVQKAGVVEPGTTVVGQDQAWRASPATVQRVALGDLSGTSVWLLALGARKTHEWRVGTLWHSGSR